MKVALNEKRKKLRGFSFSINIANFEANLSVFKLTKNPLFLKSDVVINTENTDKTRVIEETTSSTSKLPELESSDHIEVPNKEFKCQLMIFKNCWDKK